MTVTWTDGRLLRVDLSALGGRLEAFALLEDASEFATARVADFGWTLDWFCGTSLDSDRLQDMALEQAELKAPRRLADHRPGPLRGPHSARSQPTNGPHSGPYRPPHTCDQRLKNRGDSRVPVSREGHLLA